MKYKHKCPEWDYMEIDETWVEIMCCTCYKDKTFLKIRDDYWVKVKEKIRDGSWIKIEEEVE